ncbi:MAG: biotin/lipoyl-binding protein [Thiolinea sp.]
MRCVHITALMLFSLVGHSTTILAAEEAQAVDALVVSVKRIGDVAVPVERDAEAKMVTSNDTPVSSELAAKVVAIEAEVGDRVEQGDVLARLDCRDFDVQLRQAEAGVATVKARIAATSARVDAAESRVSAAASRVNAANSRVNAAGSGVSSAQARVNAATARVQATRTTINSAKSRVSTAQAQANAARARIPAAQAQFKLAQAELQRTQQLRQDKLIPANVFEQARAGFDSAQSSLNAAQADFAAAQAAVVTANQDISAAQANVQAGQADIESAKAEVASGKANVGSAKADVGTASAELETSKAELEGAKADLLVVRTELESALAQQEAAEIVSGRCVISAPFAGQVTQRPLQLGQISAPGSPAFQLLQHQGLEVVAQLSPDEIRDQEQGEKVRFVAGTDELDVERRAVVAQVNSDTGTQEVRYRVSSEHDLPVGKTGRLRWQGKLPAIPADWLLRREGGLGLMLAVDGEAEFYPLEGAREGQPALIDLPADTLLIDANRLRVRNGQKIQLSE